MDTQGIQHLLEQHYQWDSSLSYEHMTDEDIAHLSTSPLYAPTITDRLIREASDVSLIEVAQTTSDPSVRQWICYVLGERRISASVPLLLQFLDDGNVSVRNNAVDALAKIGDYQAGSILLDHFMRETDYGVRTMLAVALGAVGYQPAIPVLIDTLHNTEQGVLRGAAAWSLGVLHADIALPALEKALSSEQENYARERMDSAIQAIKAAITTSSEAL